MEKKSSKQKSNASSFSKILFLNKKELNFFISNLAVLISSGLTVLDSLKAIQFEVKSKFLKDQIAIIVDNIESGYSLSQALEESKLFPSRALELIRIGENTGRLADNLRIINEQQVKERELKSRLTSAMIYPGIVMALTLVIGLAISYFVLPRLSSVYNNLRVPLPAITKFLLDIGDFMGKYGAIVIPIVIILMILSAYLLFVNPKTKKSGQFILFKIPITKNLISEIEISRMGFILGTLIKSGVPLIESLEFLQGSTDFYKYKRLYGYIKEKIEEGYSFDKTFREFPKIEYLFPPAVTSLITTGEQSGTLSDLLMSVSTTYEAKSANTTRNLSTVLEPVLLIVVWLGVVFVAFAVVLPVYSLVGNLNESADTQAEPASTDDEEEVVPTEIVTPTEIVPTLTQTPEPSVIATPIQNLKINAQVPVNVRDKPSTNGILITKVNDEEIYQYTDKQSNWYQIILKDGRTGWISGDYIQLVSN